MSQNFATSKKSHKAAKFVFMLAVVVFVISLGGAVALEGPTLLGEWRMRGLAKEAVSGDASPQKIKHVVATEDKPSTQQAVVSQEVQKKVDFKKLTGINSDVVGWISMPDANIDFPVMKGRDNEEYLHKDIYGMNSFDGVFLDWRADPNGKAAVIYGHTLRHGGMFSDLSLTQHQETFDKFKDSAVYWTTKAGTTTYQPVCALTVPGNYEPYQRFSFVNEDVKSSAAYKACEMAYLKRHQAAGEYNKLYLEEQLPAVSDDMARIDKAEVDSGYVGYWKLTDDEKAACVKQAGNDANEGEYQAYLKQLLDDASASRSDAADLMKRSTQTMILCCCSWPFNAHRTLFVCVK